MPASALNVRNVAGRPPVDGACSLSMTKPRAVSAVTRADTAVRDSPVS
jgi:hypothetical protein